MAIYIIQHAFQFNVWWICIYELYLWKYILLFISRTLCTYILNFIFNFMLNFIEFISFIEYLEYLQRKMYW